MTRRLFAVGILAASSVAQPVAAAGAADGHAHAENSPIGVAGKATAATRIVKVEMTDAMRFIPPSVRVARGETVRFVVTNTGKLKHEFVLGTEKELKAHHEVMKRFPEMEHADPNMVTVAPGKTGEVVWRFTKAGTVDIGCLQPGHYDAGMKGAVTVGAVKGRAKSDPRRH